MILLKLDGIDGDCEIEKWKGYITLSSVSWAITREPGESAKMGTKAIVTGMPDLPAIEIGKSMDKASVYLMQNSISGSSMGTAEIKFISQAGTEGTGDVFLEFKLDNAIISGWSISGDADDRPSETIALWYHKIWMQYYESSDGKTYTSAGSRGWDRVANKAWTG